MRLSRFRNVVTIAGVVVVIAIVAFANKYTAERGREKILIGLREKIVASIAQGAMGVLDWELLKQTGGDFASGPEYPEPLKELEGGTVWLAGYATPPNLDDYVQASVLGPLLSAILPAQSYINPSKLLMSPVPFTYYFRDAPPINEVVYVEFEEQPRFTVDAETPLMVRGRLELPGEGDRFFYIIREAMYIPVQ